jgi:hypothetical protein
VNPPAPGQPTVCTQDAKVCPDGTTVPRLGPECEFAACPGNADTPPNNGLSPDPAPDGPDGNTDPKPIGTFSDPEPPPS